MQAWECRKTILVVTFCYYRTLTPNQPEQRNHPFFRLTRFSTSLQLWTFALATWRQFRPARISAWWYPIYLCRLACPSPVRILPMVQARPASIEETKLPAPHTSISNRLGNHVMHIFFWVYTVVMRPQSKTQVRKDPTVGILPIVVYIGAMKNNYPGVNIRP